MRSIIIVEVLPHLQLRTKIHVIRVGQQLIKLGLIRSVGTFDFAIQLGCLRFDINMAHSLVFDMPVKTSLKLLAPVGSDRADAEEELIHYIVHEQDRTILVMLWKDL